MKQFLLTLTMIALFCLGCQRSERVREVVAPTKGPSTPEPGTGTVDSGGGKGTVDSGGAHGINGRPLESYRAKILEVREVREHVMPFLKKLAKSFPRLAGEMYYILNERVWYFVPVELRKIPAKNVGSYAETDQLARQNLRDIWIYSINYLEKMNTEDRVNILIHELLLGVHLLKYTSKLDQCVASITHDLLEKETQARHNKNRSACYVNQKQVSDFGISSRASIWSDDIHLSEGFYSVLRKLTTDLIHSDGQVNREELEVYLEEQGFRNYREKKSGESSVPSGAVHARPE